MQVRLSEKNKEKLQLICCQVPTPVSVNWLANKAISEWPGLRVKVDTTPKKGKR